MNLQPNNHSIFYFPHSKLFAIILFSIFYFLFSATFAFAADIFLLPETKDLRLNELYEIQLFVSSSETVNAFEGKILFSKDNLKAEEIKDGNSLVNLWIEKPKENEAGVISFSGITPGGYKGENGYLFSIIFKAIGIDSGELQIKDVKVLKNDGYGTSAKVQLKDSSYKILGESIGEEDKPTQKLIIADKVTPEEFKPEIAQDKNIFDGKYFLVFVAQDKISGIAHYEVREGFFGKFAVAESPYLLKNQKLNKKIIVKAIDKVGNERVKIIYPSNWSPWYENYWIIGIIITIIVAGYFRRRRKGRK